MPNVNPKTKAQALERMKTLPWAYHGQDEGLALIAQWQQGHRLAVLEELNDEIATHFQCGNYAKAGYIKKVAVVLRRIAVKDFDAELNPKPE